MEITRVTEYTIKMNSDEWKQLHDALGEALSCDLSNATQETLRDFAHVLSVRS